MNNLPKKTCPRCHFQFKPRRVGQTHCRTCITLMNSEKYIQEAEKRRNAVRLHSPVIMEYDPDGLYNKGADFDVHTIPGQLGSRGITLRPDCFAPGTIVLSGEEKKRYKYDGKKWAAVA